MADIRIGTMAFTKEGWAGTFYPAGMKSADFLSYYATKFDTVEIDSTFYRTPSANTVREWAAKTPKGFLFAAKVPQVITHKKVLVDCEDYFSYFVTTMDLLGDKLGPLLFQFGYFGSKAFASVDDFVARLRPFLKKLPKGHRFAVEIRNKNWLAPALIEALRERGVALALTDQSWMPRPAEWFKKEFDPVTADFAYVRLLGDRKAIEKKTKVFNKVLIDRKAEIAEWTKMFEDLKTKVQVHAYASNYYQGYAPATVERLRALFGREPNGVG